MISKFAVSSLTLRARIILTSLAVTLALAFMTAVLAGREYRTDRIAYLFELHAARTSAVASSLREALITQSLEQSTSIWNAEVPKDLPRRPYDNEIFVTQSSDHLRILRSDPQSVHLLSSPLSKEALLNALNPHLGIPLLIVSQSGDRIQSMNHSLSESAVKSIIYGAFKSQLTEGQTVFPIEGTEVAVSFREVPMSNLLVVTFTPLTRLFDPLRQGLLKWVLWALPLILVGLLAQGWILGTISRPIQQMIAFFQSLSQGNFSLTVTIPNGEFKPVFAGAAAMQKAIASREERLRLFSAGLERTLDFARNPNLARDYRKAAERLEELLGQIVRLHPKFYALVFDAQNSLLWLQEHKGKWISTSQGQDLVRKYLGEPHLSEGGIVHAEGNSTHAVALAIPITSGEDRQGLILLPLDDDQELSELWNLAPVITNALAGMTLHCKAFDLVHHESAVAAELSLARKVQERSLVAGRADIPGLWIDAIFEPAELVGGDWMGIFPHVSAGIINIYVGDVTGHGIDSAFHTSLVAGAAKTIEDELEEHPNLFSGSYEHQDGFNPTQHCRRTWYRLNKVLLDSDSGKTMTMLILSVNVRDGTVNVLSAGHPAPLWIRPNGTEPRQPTSLLVRPTHPLGSPADEIEVSVQTFKLNPGDTVVSFTDGFQENVVISDRNIGSRAVYRSAQKIMSGWKSKSDSPLRALYNWSLTAGDEYHNKDDVALVAFRYVGLECHEDR
jgi:serine phosphatase RsbU (regulator of sigma subunit)